MSFEITEEDVPYHPDGHLCRMYLPKDEETKKRPVVLDLHGGTWTKNDRTLDVVCNQALAKAGFVVAAIDFRMGPTHQFPASNQDIVQALRWLQTENIASQYRLDTNQIGILGTSSGGHLALVAGIAPNAYNADDETPVPVPKFIVALWPVSCPLQRYRYAKRAKRDDLIRCHEGYFGTEKSMKDASVPRLLMAGKIELDHNNKLPPLLLVVPGEDANVPLEINLDLLQCWQKCDGELDYAFFPKQAHAFGLYKENPETERMNKIIVDFCKRVTTSG